MDGADDNRNSVPGFYVAHHPWFDAERGPGGLHKAGHTGDLRRRLYDDAYVTCFPDGFRFVWTFETRTKHDAHRLESGVLRCAAALRVARATGAAAELVKMTAGDIAALALRVAAALNIEGEGREAPVYPRRQPRRPAPGAPPGREPPPVQFGEEEAALLAALAPPDEDAYLEELLGGIADLAIADLREEAPPRKSAADYLREARAKILGAGAESDGEGDGEGEGEDDVEDDVEDEGEDDVEDDIFDVLDLLGETALDVPTSAAPPEARAYQTEAVAASLRELAARRRAVLQMACRCGKTLVAKGVIQDYFDSSRRAAGRPVALYLVPGLALLRQTAQKLDNYGIDADLLLVGSDPRPLEGLTSLRLTAPAATTDPELVADTIRAENGRPLLVVSTYQSSPLLPDAFDLTVFDESHRVCGEVRPRPFTHTLLNTEAGDRLYMTATPRYDAPLSMKDRDRFGGVAYAYHMREGIDAGYVNDFGLELVGRQPHAEVDDKDATAGQIVAALDRLKGAAAAAHPGAAAAAERPAGKLLVFCRSIRHASELAEAVRAELAASPASSAAACLCAHSRMSRAEIGESLARFCAPGEPAILFNCRLFQEGVEIPALNGVFFASPRHSPRDIIQSLCRPLNVLPGKPPSKVFIPVTLAPDAAPDAPANLARFASIVPYFDALVAEDPLLYEHLLDPRGTPYALEWVDTAAGSAGARVPAKYRPAALLSAARRTVRRGGNGKTERLLRAARIPWAIGFGELRRIVVECGRYPKTTDTYQYSADAKVNFGQFYRYARESYAKWQAGVTQPLEPRQLRDLESLPGWAPYGIEGPYPWKETLTFLDWWLTENGGVPPMVEINCGGYVGLEASPMERLSGTLTCINQSDGRDRKSRDGPPRPGSGFTLEASKRRDLDELCMRHGIRWRKDRMPGATPGAVGSLVEKDGVYAGRPTFIQEAYQRFKAEWKREGEKSAYVNRWYISYPLKHRRQERPDVWERRKELIPPRWRGRGKAPETKFDAGRSIFM